MLTVSARLLAPLLYCCLHCFLYVELGMQDHDLEVVGPVDSDIRMTSYYYILLFVPNLEAVPQIEKIENKRRKSHKVTSSNWCHVILSPAHPGSNTPISGPTTNSFASSTWSPAWHVALKCQVCKKACHLNSWNPSWTWSPWRSWWPRGRNFLICSLQYSCCFVGICWWNWWLFVWRSCDSRDNWWPRSQESRSRSRSHSPAIPSFLPGTPRDAGYAGTPRHVSEPEPQADQAQGGNGTSVARVSKM